MEKELLKNINSVLANKTLSFGCRVIIKETGKESRICGVTFPFLLDAREYNDELYYKVTNSEKLYTARQLESLWHPVMFGDLFQWAENQWITDMEKGREFWELYFWWVDKTKSIDSQPLSYLKFVDSMLPE